MVSPETYCYQTETAPEPARTAASGADTEIPAVTRRAVDLLASDQEITGGQAERIARSPEAVALLGQLTGSEINTDAPLSRVKADIRAVAGTRSSAQGERRADGDIGPYGGKSRTAAQRVYDVNLVSGAASSSGMGESGQRAISAAYDGSVDADRYYAGFTAYYEAGLSGRAQEQVRSDYAADLTEAQRYAAYTAGQNDAAASLAREKLAAQFAQTAGEDSGLVYDDFVREAVESGRTASGENGSGPVYLTQETAERVNSVAKVLGLRVRFVDQVDGGRANAEIRGSEVQIEKNNPLPVQFLMGHEVTHRLQELAPEEYRAFREVAAQDEMVQTYVREYTEGDSGLTYEQALDEAAADYAGRLLEDGELLDQFIGRNQDNRTLLEKVRDAIRTPVRRLTGAEKKAAQTAEGKLSAALEAGAKRAENLQERQGDGTMDTTRNSLKEDGDHGRAREETRGAFLRRAAGAGYAVYEGETAAYGFRRAGQPDDGGNHGEITQEAQDTQRELTALGVSADIVDGPILRNRNGVTEERAVTQAVTVDRSHIFISKDTTLSPRNIAGHEAFHLWKSGTGRDSYIEILEDNLLFSSEAFREYQTPIAEAYLGGEADLANDAQMDKMREEIFAYLSGDIHEGTNEDALRPIFRDFDAVRTAWENLVEENRGGTTRSRYSLKEDRDHGRAREETRGAFLRRAAGAGYAVYEGETAAYGFRRAGQPDDGGNHGEITQEAQDTQRELTALGVSADIVDGPILRNRNGVTEERAVTQAVTVDRSHIFISKDTTLSPRNIAGHEAFHLWKSGTGRDSYIEILEDNLLFSSEAFREYQTPIAEAYLGGEADLANDAQMDKMREEIFAYISGDIHEGTNETLLRPMFRDFDAVRAAWEQLVEENRGRTARSRYSRKEDGANGREEVERRTEGEVQQDHAGGAGGNGQSAGEDGGYGDLRSVRGMSQGQRPVHAWAEGGLTVPEPGSVAESEAYIVQDEYNLPVFVVKSDIFNQNHATAPAFSSRGQVFLREDLPESGRGDIGAHEAGHAMKQLGYQPYLDFIDRAPDFVDQSTREAGVLMEGAAQHLGINLFDMSEQDTVDLFDEINNMVYGAIHAGRTEILELVRPAFYDFDAYSAELTQIHEQFKQERGGAQARESRKGFSVDRELDREIRQIVKEAREGGRSEEAVQADIRELVQESYQRMAEQYGTIPAGERPAREARVPRRTAEDRVVSQTVRTVLEAGATPEAAIPNIEELTARGVFSYTRYTDKQAMEDAEGVTRDIIGQTGINKLERETHIFQVEGGTVTLSTAQIMSLYELMKREQAQERIFIGGIRPETILGQRGIRESRKSAPVRVTAEDLSVYISDLKDRTTQSSLQKIFSVYCVSFSIQ